MTGLQLDGAAQEVPQAGDAEVGEVLGQDVDDVVLGLDLPDGGLDGVDRLRLRDLVRGGDGVHQREGVPEPVRQSVPVVAPLPALRPGGGRGEQVRGGQDNKDILTTYTGSVPGDAVAHIIPGASGDFDASYDIDSDGQLVQAALTGVFYSGSPSMTYTLTLSDYGTTQDVTAP